MALHRSPAGGLGALLAAAFTLSACETDFVEPNPPILLAGERVFEDPAVPEPTVVAILVDLHIPDPLVCADVKARLEAAVHEAVAASGAPAIELPSVDLSPGCVQRPDRSFVAGPLASLIRAARASFPDRAVRPLVVYANNIDLDLPFPIWNGLHELRLLSAEPGLEPLMYVVGLVQGPPFDRALRWTHGTDPGLWSGLRTRVDGDLPFLSRRGGTVSAPLLDPSLVGPGALYRVCSTGGNAAVTACSPGRAQPCSLPPEPIATATFAPALAVPGALSPVRAVVSYEVCTGRCSRFLDLDGRLVPWTELAGCSWGAP